MEYVRDVLYIKTLEQSIGRKLTDEELEIDTPFEVTFKNGVTDWVEIPRLPFPTYFIDEVSSINYYKHAPYETIDK